MVMSKKILSPVLLGALTLSLEGCYKDIDLEKYRPDPVIVVNSAVSPDSTIMASVTHTWFYAGTEAFVERYVNLSKARVELFVNDEFREIMQWKQYLPADTQNEVPDSVFMSHIKPKEGDRIKLVVSADGYQTVTAETCVPKRVPVVLAECTGVSERINPQGNIGDGYGNTIPYNYYALTYRLAFRDEKDEDNYYALTFLRQDDFYGTWYHPHIETSDPVLSENMDALDGAVGFDGMNTGACFLFTDRQIAGKQYTLSFEEWTGSYDNPDSPPLTVRLYSLSEDYYRYLFSVSQIAGSTLDEALGNLGFGEPLRVYSNVEGGTGILGACCVSEKKVKGLTPSV